MLNLLLARYSQGMATFLTVLKIVCFVLIAISAIVLIVVVMMQAQAEGSGRNVINGVSESYYSQNRGRTKESKLKIITIICSSAIAVLSICLILLI